MPLGPYKTWNDCIISQRKKGHSEESAKKICGEIEKRTKEGKGDITDKEIAQLLVEDWISNNVLNSTREKDV